MALTPEEIAAKEFLVGLRGYDKEEVRVFLNAVSVDYRALVVATPVEAEEAARSRRSRRHLGPADLGGARRGHRERPAGRRSRGRHRHHVTRGLARMGKRWRRSFARLTNRWRP